MRAIAGLERPSAGRVRIGDRTVFDAVSGIDLPPDRRGFAMVFQSYAMGDPPAPDCCVCFRPTTVTLATAPAPGAFAATIESATFSGDWTEYELRSGRLTIRARRLGRGDLPIGKPVFWPVLPGACFLVPE